MLKKKIVSSTKGQGELDEPLRQAQGAPKTILKKVLGVSLIAFLFVTSCNQFWISGILKQADEAEIQFYGKGDSATAKPIAIISVTDKAELEKIESFISEEETKSVKCPYDGTIKFKSKGEVLVDTEFNLQPDCRHIAFVLNNKVQFRKLTEEGFNYLLSISKQQAVQE